MLIPEVIIYNNINKFLNLLTQDFANYSENCTMLYSMFHTDDNNDRIVYETYDWYNQAKSLLLRNQEKARRIEVSMGYNLQRIAVPTIHILLPTETKGRYNTLGASETVPEISQTCGDKLTITKYSSNSVTYHLMMTSDNSHEVLIMYYFLKYMFNVLAVHFELLGFQNLNFSGQDINMQMDITAPHIFHRNLSMSFDYENVFKFDYNEDLVNGLNFKVCDDFSVDNDEFIHDNELPSN